MDKSIKAYINKQCIGCNTCIASCPVDAITHQVDKDGFWHPMVDEGLCINCGKCTQSCAIYGNRTKELFFEEPKAYVGWNLDANTRKNSSSGGIFSLIATPILSEGGVVYGAAYNESFHVEHVRIDTLEGLAALRGSKYIQSFVSPSIYECIDKDIKSGKQVLFSGTSCQTAALNQYYKNCIPENLLTVDVLCHGVASPKAWQCYLEEISAQHKTNILSVNMRDKLRGWHHGNIKIQFEDGEIYNESYREGIWGPSYFKDLFFRESCYSCAFRERERTADISLGDFWSAVKEKTLNQYDDHDKGTSLILINSLKGANIVQNLKNCFLESVPYECLLKSMWVLYRSGKRHIHRDEAFERLGNEPYSVIVDSSVRRMKPGEFDEMKKNLLQ